MSISFDSYNIVEDDNLITLAMNIIEKLNDTPKIEMVDINNDNVLKIFKSTDEIRNYLNIKSASHILGCCRKERKSAYGYKWRYRKDDSNN